MSTIIRATDGNRAVRAVAFNFDDLSAEAERYLAKVRAEAAKLVAQARQEAVAIRQRAEAEGKQAAWLAVEKLIAGQLGPTLTALRQAIDEVLRAKSAWLNHWEGRTVHLAAAIARRVIRQELTRQPQITTALVREALELAAGSAEVRIHLHPDDQAALRSQVEEIIREVSRLGTVEVVPDPRISRGGCRVETRFGVIDQQFEAQLARIEEELT
jgi:flagellar assembly protein FliH